MSHVDPSRLKRIDTSINSIMLWIIYIDHIELCFMTLGAFRSVSREMTVSVVSRFGGRWPIRTIGNHRFASGECRVIHHDLTKYSLRTPLSTSSLSLNLSAVPPHHLLTWLTYRRHGSSDPDTSPELPLQRHTPMPVFTAPPRHFHSSSVLHGAGQAS